MAGQTRRIAQILRVARRYGLGELFADTSRSNWLARTLGAGKKLDDPIGPRLRQALEELGPVFIKFGQALSTRRDLLPPGLADDLIELQDAVAPFAGDQARELIETAYGESLDQRFAWFDPEPLAAASIAQVHAARLHPRADQTTGDDVVIKVLRPHVHHQVARDIAVLYRLARLIAHVHPEASRLRPVEVVAEYERIIHDELDLLREGANASQLGRNWAGSDLIAHPTIYFDHSTENVLVMARIFGTPIDDVETLKAAGVDFKVLAERGVEIFFQQVFRDNFFHADMHPGNIFVDTTHPHRPRYIGLDFGIVGSLTPADQRYLAENFLAFFNRDYRRIAELHVESGWMPADTRIEEFEAAIRTVSEPIFHKPLAEISFGVFLIRLFKIARRYRYHVQPQLVLLQKTVLNVEGLGRDLYPQLDLWATAKPILEQWMARRADPRRAARRLQDQWPQIVDSLPEFAYRWARQIDAPVDTDTPSAPRALVDVTHELRATRRSQRWSLFAAGLLALAGVLTAADTGLAAPLATGLAGLGCGLRALTIR
ncbi:ubiquinone biosynthesis regulatory protein kinase UbiB [Salinisphaera sp. USBA-960]|nr:ubiquinone biosynthesis regulatory protein kinase UbiB [Salifodinibacter halophilus]NNC27000.1 ubiquinone biosynthesis regulatory protein kinase UbiB [Salifodinibacter halophilus]